MAQYPPYSETFLAVTLTTTGAVDYTVPAGRVAVIDSVSIVQYQGNIITYGIAATDPTGSGTFHVFWAATIAVGANANARQGSQWRGRHTVRAGGKIRAQTAASSAAYITISGFLLRETP